MAYKFRNELVFFDKLDDQYLFYAPTLSICILGTYNLIERMKLHLIGKEYFSEFQALLEEAYDSRVEVFNLQSVRSKYFHIALGLTENCTLSCIYCHADAGKNTFMPDEILIAAVEYAKNQIKNNKLKGINLSFAVGGEPTYNVNLLKKSLNLFNDAAKECQVELKTSMTTNGYYNEEMARFVGNNVDNILISIDGLEYIQNLHRPTRSGAGSFDTVLKTMDIIYNIKNELNLRSTVSNISVHKLREFVDFLSDRYRNNITLVLEPLVPLGRGANCTNNNIGEPDDLVFAKQFWDAYCYGQERNVKLRTSAMNADRLVSGFCGAMFIPSFTVTTSGIVTTCERDSTGKNYGYGKYDPTENNFIIDEDRVLSNRKLVEIPEYCDECICRYHCAGDCPDVRTINYNRCEINRYLLKCYIKMKLNRKEGMTDYEAGGSIEAFC